MDAGKPQLMDPNIHTKVHITHYKHRFPNNTYICMNMSAKFSDYIFFGALKLKFRKCSHFGILILKCYFLTFPDMCSFLKRQKLTQHSFGYEIYILDI
jgi:hypothetical protein